MYTAMDMSKHQDTKDDQMIYQLQSLNQNIRLLVQSNMGIHENLLRMNQKQDKLIELQTELLDFHKERTLLEKPMLDLERYQSKPSVVQPQQPQLSRNQSSPTKIESPTKKHIIAKKTKAQQTHHKDTTQPFKFPHCITIAPFQQQQLYIDVSKHLQRFTTVDLQNAKNGLTSWIGETYTILAQKSFSGFLSHYFNLPQTKVYYTHNLALNFSLMTQYFWKNHKDFWLQHSQSLTLHFQQQSSKVLDFMMIKYPQKQKTYQSAQMHSAIKTLDNSMEPQYDYLRNTGLLFEYDETRKSYAQTIKKALNRIIEESERQFSTWECLMKGVFNLEGRELHSRIGMKFKENTPLYTEDEIREEGVRIKTSEVLRVVIKWIEELEKKVNGLYDGTYIHNTFNSRDCEGPQYLNRWMKRDLNQFLKKKQPQLKRAQQQRRLRIRSLLQHFPCFLQKYQTLTSLFNYLSPNQVKSGLLSSVLAQSASNLSTNYLIFLIHLLMQASKVLSRGVGNKQVISVDYNGIRYSQTSFFFTPQFVTFTLSDLLRCKCTGSIKDVKAVYEKLQNHHQLTVYRVKNRIDTSNKDFLVNVKLKGTPLLCEVQLAIIDKAGEEKQQLLNSFSHFMYELSRASYGPIAEAVMINSHLTEFVPFFMSRIKKLEKAKKAVMAVDVKAKLDGDGMPSVEGYLRRSNDFSYICSNCLEFKVACQSHLINFDSTESALVFDKQSIKSPYHLMICGECAYIGLSPAEQSEYLLGKPKSYFFQGLKEATVPQIVCAVKKKATQRKVLILQRCVLGINTVYVPVFYEQFQSKKQKIHINQRQLSQDYYLFKIKPQAQFLNVDPVAIAYHYSLSPNTHLELKNMLSSQSALIIPPNFPPMRVVSAYNSQNMGFLNRYAGQKVQVMYSPQAPVLMLINNVVDPKDLERIAKKGRILKESERNALKENKIWRLDKSDLDDNSFDFCSEDPPVEELHLMENSFTDFHLMIGSQLRKIDLTENRIKKLRLQRTDLPKLTYLDLSFNQIDLIQKLQHGSLQELRLNVNKISNLKQKQWLLPKLQLLQLSNNKLTEIDLFCFKNISRISFGNNPIVSLIYPDVMPNLQAVQIGNIQSLKTIEFSKTNFPQVKRFQINRIPIQHLTFPKSLPAITHIFLTQIPSLKGVTLPQNLPSLQQLAIQTTGLIQIDFSSCSLPKLTYLYLQQNKIERVRWSQSMQSIHTIAMNRNCLSQVDFMELPEKTINIITCEANYITSVKLLDKTVYPNLSILLFNANLFNAASNINVVLQKGPYFPKLGAVRVGLQKNRVQTVLWLISRLPKKKLAEVFLEASKIAQQPLGSGPFQKLFDQSWEENDIPDELKKNSKSVLIALRNLGLTPKIFDKQIQTQIQSPP